ncbi:MAG: DUF4156 domain-containing protein [Myxococcota bacterium]
MTGRMVGQGAWVTALVVVCMTGACAFVQVEENARGVEVRKAEAEVEACTRKGTVSASTKANVGFIDRNETTVAVELERLARNRAVNLGANVIVPLGPVSEEGSREYSAWACPE